MNRLSERIARYREEWGWHEATDDLLAGFGHHMGQMLYRLPADSQTDDMQASITAMLADLAALAARLASVEALVPKWRASARSIRDATGDYEDGVEYLAAADDLAAVLGSDAHTEQNPPACAVPRRYFVQQTCELPTGHAGDHEDATHLWENDAHSEQKGAGT